jgi:hypothetical protein
MQMLDHINVEMMIILTKIQIPYKMQMLDHINVEMMIT